MSDPLLLFAARITPLASSTNRPSNSASCATATALSAIWEIKSPLWTPCLLYSGSWRSSAFFSIEYRPLINLRPSLVYKSPQVPFFESQLLITDCLNVLGGACLYLGAPAALDACMPFFAGCSAAGVSTARGVPFNAASLPTLSLTNLGVSISCELNRPVDVRLGSEGVLYPSPLSMKWTAPPTAVSLSATSYIDKEKSPPTVARFPQFISNALSYPCT